MKSMILISTDQSKIEIEVNSEFNV